MRQWKLWVVVSAAALGAAFAVYIGLAMWRLSRTAIHLDVHPQADTADLEVSEDLVHVVLERITKAVYADGAVATASVIETDDGARVDVVRGSGSETGEVFQRIRPESLAITANGETVAYLADAPEGRVLVMGAERYPAKTIVEDSIVLSGHGGHAAWVERDPEGRFRTVVDGEPGVSYEGIGPTIFSPDGQRAAYGVVNGKTKHVLVDGVVGPPRDDIDMESIVFSEDGAHLAYRAKRGERVLVVVDEAEGPLFDEADRPILSPPDGRRVAYAARTGEAWFVVVGEERWGPYGSVGFGAFSDDGAHVAFAVERGGKWHNLVDGELGPPFDGILRGTPHFRPGSDAIAYGAHEGNDDFLVMDGERTPVYDGFGDGHPLFSPDGASYAYMAGRGDETYVCLNGDVSGPYRSIVAGVEGFGPTGVFFCAAETDSGAIGVVDGHETSVYDQILPCGPEFTPDGGVRFLAVKEGVGVYVVTARPKSAATAVTSAPSTSAQR